MSIPSLRRVALAASVALFQPLVQAEGAGTAVPVLPRYQQECAACHIAYPPRMLPAESWRRVLNGLPNHFGTDASLDAESVRHFDVIRRKAD